MTSNKEKSDCAMSRLHLWLKAEPVIPKHHDRIICQILGILVSTIPMNKGLAAIDTPSQVIAALFNEIEKHQIEISELLRKVECSRLPISDGMILRDH